jgi:hypothetical protein
VNTVPVRLGVPRSANSKVTSRASLAILANTRSESIVSCHPASSEICCKGSYGAHGAVG